MAAFTLAMPDGPIAEFLSAQASERGCTARQVVLAMLHCIARDDMADAILDGEDPGTLFPHGLKRPGYELTDFQQRVLRAVAARKIGNGLCVVSITDLSDYLCKNRGQCRNTITALVERGYLSRVVQGSSQIPSRYRLTERAAPFLVNRPAGRAA